MFPTDFKDWNISRIANEYFKRDGNNRFIGQKRSEMIYSAIDAMDDDGRLVQGYLNDLELLVAVKSLVADEKLNVGISHNNSTRKVYMQNLIVAKGQAIVKYCSEYKSSLPNNSLPDLGGYKSLDSYGKYGKKLCEANLTLYSSILLLNKLF